MRGPRATTISDFSVGLIETEGGIDLQAGAAQAMQNVMPIVGRGIKRRDPAGQYNAFGETIWKVWHGPLLGDELAIGASNVYRGGSAVSLGAHGFGTGAYPTIVEAPTSGGQGPVWMQFAGVAKYVTAAFALGTWTASAGTLPLSQTGVIAYHGNRMWVANVSGNTSRLYFSEINDPRVWSGGTSGFVDIDTSSSGAITAICPCGPYLLVFKFDRVYVVYDLSTGANRQIASNMGTQDMQSVTQARYGTAYFVNPQGDGDGAIFRTDGSTTQLVSGQLHNRAPKNNSNYAGMLSYTNGFLAHYTYGPLDIYCEQLNSWWPQLFTATGYISSLSAIDRPNGGFFLPNGASVGWWFPNIEDASGTVSPVAGDDFSGAFTSYWWGADSDLGSPQLRKRLRHVDIEGAGLASAGVAKDCASSAPAVTALSFLPSASKVKSARLNNLGVAHYWAPYLYDSTSNAWTVRAITLDFAARTN